jgi:hypothetical protein
VFAPDLAAADSLGAIARAFDEGVPADMVPTWRRFQPYKGRQRSTRRTPPSSSAAMARSRRSSTCWPVAPDRIVALVGQSEVGKSSLARAGVMARLKSQLWPGPTSSWPAALKDNRQPS